MVKTPSAFQHSLLPPGRSAPDPIVDHIAEGAVATAMVITRGFAAAFSQVRERAPSRSRRRQVAALLNSKVTSSLLLESGEGARG